ncbi:MAG: lipid A export permease/ATP-binding protein MsbA [Gammaproteobacteria bacterium]|nr:lipid A export permease/ATP-binding protein MsbA [Gammaproteobacteria bacterium]
MSRKQESIWPVYRRLLGYSAPYKGVFIIAVLASIVSAAGEAGSAWLMKPLMDDAFVARDEEIIKLIPFGVVLIALLRGFGTFGATFFISWIARNVIKTLRQQVFEKLLVMPAGYYDKSSGGNLVSTITYNIEQVAESSARAFLVILTDSLKIIAMVGFLLYMSWQLTIFIFIITPIMSLIVRWVSKRFRRYSERIQSSMGDVTHVSEEIIQGQRVIKIFGGEEYEKDRFSEVNERNRRLFMKLFLTKSGSVPVVQIIGSIGIALVIYFAASGGAGFQFTPGDFTAYLSAMLILTQPLKRLTEVNEPLQRGIAAARSIFELLDEPPQPDSGDKTLDRVTGKVAFESVEFGYNDGEQPVLHDISFEVAAGQTIALVGRSGSGKSSLVNLIPRFYEPRAGTIRVDGHDIRDVRLDSLRRHIALVSQDIILFNDTIARNIAYGQLGDASDEEIREAARAAHALEFIESLPQGFDTIVGDRGLLLSGGQRQRIAIARALLKNAPILILDEATSALDTESERHIQAGLEELMKSRTTFVIAHRLSTIERADRILVMREGQVIEDGTHQELLAAEGVYAGLHKLQFQDMD